MTDFNEKAVFITGALSGIGAADADRIVNETIKNVKKKLDILLNHAGFSIRDNIVEAELSDTKCRRL